MLRYYHIIVNCQENVYYHSNEDFIPLSILSKKLTLLFLFHFFVINKKMLFSLFFLLITYRYFVLLKWDFHNVKELSFSKDIKKIILTLILN